MAFDSSEKKYKSIDSFYSLIFITEVVPNWFHRQVREQIQLPNQSQGRPSVFAKIARFVSEGPLLYMSLLLFNPFSER